MSIDIDDTYKLNVCICSSVFDYIVDCSGKRTPQALFNSICNLAEHAFKRSYDLLSLPEITEQNFFHLSDKLGRCKYTGIYTKITHNSEKKNGTALFFLQERFSVIDDGISSLDSDPTRNRCIDLKDLTTQKILCIANVRIFNGQKTKFKNQLNKINDSFSRKCTGDYQPTLFVILCSLQNLYKKERINFLKKLGFTVISFIKYNKNIALVDNSVKLGWVFARTMNENKQIILSSRGDITPQKNIICQTELIFQNINRPISIFNEKKEESVEDQKTIENKQTSKHGLVSVDAIDAISGQVLNTKREGLCTFPQDPLDSIENSKSTEMNIQHMPLNRRLKFFVNLSSRYENSLNDALG